MTTAEWILFKRDCPKCYAAPHNYVELCVTHGSEIISGCVRPTMIKDGDCRQPEDCPRLKAIEVKNDVRSVQGNKSIE